MENVRVALLASFLIVAFAGSASAARLLEAYIERDGEVVVHTFYQDGGRADAATVWRYLGQRPIMVDDDVTDLEGDERDPLTATLEGDLVVRFQHTSRVIAQVRLASLTLIRADSQTQEWYLPEMEVERTAGLAGLGPPNTPPPDPMMVSLLVAGVIAVVVLVGLVAVVIVLFRRADSQ